MLYISLLIYLILWIPYFKLMPLEGILVWLSPILLYVISILFSLLILYVIHSFNPEAKPFLRNLLRLPGVKWISFLTSVMAFISLALIAIFKDLGPGISGLLLPTGIISILNALGIEFFPRMLMAEEVIPRLVTLPEELKPPEIPQDIVKEFRWEHKGQSYSLRLVIRHTIYEDFKSRARILRGGEWAREYVANGICGEIRELAYGLLRAGKPYGTYEEVDFVLSFVQNVIKYQKEEGEYPKYPVETLVDEVGDCEDFSILGASLLKIMGYDVALLLLPGHAALGVAGATGIPDVYIEHEGRNYYYCEMTATGWKIGQIPDEYKDAKIEVHPIPGVVINTNLT